MADKKIIDLTALSSQQLTDLYETSANGAGSFKETRAQMLSYMNANLQSAEQEIYISNDGMDAAGRGNVNNPYASLDYAISQITDNSSSKIYNIECLSNVNINTLNIKPNVLINFNGNSLTVNTSVTLDAGWSAGGVMYLNNANTVTLPADVTLDFSVSSCPFALVNISDFRLVNSNTVITVTSNPTGSVILFAQDIFGASNEFQWIINNCFGAISGGASMDITINHDSEMAGGNFTVQNITEIGNVLVTTSTSSALSFSHIGCEIIGTATYQSTGDGGLTVISKGTSYFSPPILDNGILGGSVLFLPDVLSQVPILLNGATFTPSSLADAVNANYSPTNYSTAGPSVNQHLAGINAALTGGGGGGSSAIVLYASSDGNDTTGDGTVEKPFATYSKAWSVAVLSASIVAHYTILIQGIINEPSDIALSPFINIAGYNSTSSQLIVAGNILKDPLWDSTVQPSFEMSSISLDAASFSFTFTGGQYVIFRIKDVVLPGSLPNITLIGSGSFTESLFIDRLEAIVNCALQISDFPAQISNSELNSFDIGSDSNSFSCSCVITGAIFNGIITVTSTGSASTAALIFGCQTYPGIALNGVNSFLTIDSSSYQNNITYTSGATITQVNILSRAEGSLANTNFTPVNYTPVADADYLASSVVGNLAGIDAAIAAGISQQLWVNYTDGNDSNSGTTLNKSLKTLDQAITNALISANPTNQFLIHVIGDQPAINSLLQPSINIDGHSSGVLTFTGSIITSNTWKSLTGGNLFVNNCILVAAGGMETDYGLGAQNTIQFNNCDFSGVAALLATADPTNASGNATLLRNMPLAASSPFPSGIQVQDSELIVFNGIMSALTVVCTGAGGTNGAQCVIENSILSGAINIIDAGTGAASSLSLTCSPLESSPILNGANTTLEIDGPSYTFAPTFVSGATISQVTIASLSDGLLQSSYTPVNFTPENAGGIYPINSMTAMINGLDAALVSSVTLQAAYNNSTPGAQGSISLASDNLNPIATFSAYTGGTQIHYQAINQTNYNSSSFNNWSIGFRAANLSLSYFQAIDFQARVQDATPGNETSSLKKFVMSGGILDLVEYTNGQSQTVTDNWIRSMSAGAYVFQSTYNLTGNLNYTGQFLGRNVVSDDGSPYTITLPLGSTAPNSDDSFTVTTQSLTVSIASSGGTLLNGSTSTVVIPAYSIKTVKLVATNTWVID